MTTLYVTYNYVNALLEELPTNTVAGQYDGVCNIAVADNTRSDTCDVTPSFNIKYGDNIQQRTYQSKPNLEWSGMNKEDIELRNYLTKLADKYKAEHIPKNNFIVNTEVKEQKIEVEETTTELVNYENEVNNTYIKEVKDEIETTLNEHKKESTKVRKEKAKELFNIQKEEIEAQKEEEDGFW